MIFVVKLKRISMSDHRTSLEFSSAGDGLYLDFDVDPSVLDQFKFDKSYVVTIAEEVIKNE